MKINKEQLDEALTIRREPNSYIAQDLLDAYTKKYKEFPDMVIEEAAAEYARIMPMLKPFGWNNTPAPTDGQEIYGVSYSPYKYRPYSPKSTEYKRGKKGRWQIMTEYGGWNNTEPPDQWLSREDFEAIKAVQHDQ